MTTIFDERQIYRRQLRDDGIEQRVVSDIKGIALAPVFSSQCPAPLSPDTVHIKECTVICRSGIPPRNRGSLPDAT